MLTVLAFAFLVARHGYRDMINWHSMAISDERHIMHSARSAAPSLLAAIAMCMMFGVAEASAHPGGLDREGCHNNRSNGTYHCHQNRRANRQVERAQSIQGDTYYRNCDAARTAGAAPIYRGQPGYRAGLDRDNDGVACEPYRNRR